MALRIHFLVQQRYVLIAIIFLSLARLYAFRASFPLILTQMVYIPNSNTTKINYTSNGLNETNSELICPIEYTITHNEASPSITDHRELYDWSQKLQGIISSSYFWGSLIAQLPGGILAQMYGGKVTLLSSTVLSAIIMAITPIAVFYGGAIGLIITRILIGILQGPIIPSIFTLITSWVPVEDRGKCCGIANMGSNVGNFVSTFIVGLTMQHIGRWDVIYYGLASMSIILAIIIALCCYDHPQTHPFISEKEKEFLKLKTAAYLEAEKENLPPTPWRAVLTSVPVLTMLFSYGLVIFSSYLLNLGSSKYLNDVLHIPIERNSIYSAIPNIVQTFVSVFAGFMSDLMHAKYKISLTNVRKTFVVLATMVPGVFATLASFGDCDETFAATMFMLAISSQGFNNVALPIVPFDLSPNYSGPLSALLFTSYSVAALLAPFIVGILTPNAYLSEWRSVWWTLFASFTFSAVLFLIWGSAKIQPWNSAKNTNQIA